MKYLTILITFSAFILFSCDNDDDAPVVAPETTAELNLNFEFKVGDENLEIGTGQYVFSDEDTVSIDQFKFILSNLVLTNEEGIEWKDDNYYLVKAESGSNTYQLTIENVPIDDYSSVEFYIGMDSALNYKPEDFPILFQQEGMYWDWSTGYKFLVFEGIYYSSTLITPVDTSGRTGLIAHVGDMMNLKIPQFDFPNTLELNLDSDNSINFEADLEEIYTNPNPLPLSEVNNRNIMGGPKAGLLSSNYSGMINLISVE